MRRITLSLLLWWSAGILTDASEAYAQGPSPRPNPRVVSRAMSAESAVKQAMEQLGDERKIFERDVAVLRHIREADEALTDPMQPTIAIQKAYDHIDEAKRLMPEFVVMQGLIKVHDELTEARRSPISADFGRLRASMNSNAERPASRVAVRNALRLEDETLMWIKVQEMIALHLRTLSEIAGESLRASQK
jgi:hypothetical protein